MWKLPLLFLRCLFPCFQEMRFENTDCLLLRDANIRHTVHVLVEEFMFILKRKCSPVLDGLVMRGRHHAEHIFLKIRPGATDSSNVTLPNHRSEQLSNSCSTHGTSEGNEDLAA